MSDQRPGAQPEPVEPKRPLAEPLDEEAPDAADLLRGVLQDERYEPGMIILDRQEVPLADDGLPAYVAEEAPTPLRGAYIYLSVIGFFCGTIVISALNLGASWSDPIVKIPVLIGALPLFIAMGEAGLRIARSVPAWWPINRGRALFRAGWVLTIATLALILALAVRAALFA